MKRAYSPITSFFIFASGVDKNWLDQCPEKELTKYYSIGSLVFLTGLLGFISSSYAFHCLFDPVPLTPSETWKINGGYVLLSVLCGLLWGIFVFFLDRAFVSTMSKNSPWFIQLLSAIPRFALALLISISISKPIEILFFRDRIVSQIQINMKADVDSYVAKIENERADINKDIVDDRKKIVGLNLEKKAPDQAEQKKLADISNCNQGNANTQNISNGVSQGISEQLKDDQKGLHELKELPYKSPQDSANIKSLEETIKSLIKSIPRGSSSDCSYLRLDYANYHSSRLSNLNESIAATQKHCHEDSLRLHNLDSTKAKNVTIISKSDSISFSQNLSAQIEALNTLINTGDSNNTNKLSIEKSRGLWWYHFVIWMLFLAIEIAPISMKLIMPRGEYDEIAKAHYQSVKNHCDAVVEKKKAEFQKYIETTKEENATLLKYFFEKIKPDRTLLLDKAILGWSTSQTTYVELLQDIFKKLFDYEPDISDQRSDQNVAPRRVPTSEHITGNKEDNIAVTPSEEPLHNRIISKIKQQLDDEITKLFFNALRIITCVLLPAFLIKILLPQDFDKLIDLIKQIKE